MNTLAGDATDSLLKRHKPMEFWYFGPVVLAIVMFLLMGTIFERRIEALYHRLINHRQAHLLQRENHDEASGPGSGPATSAQAAKTPSQRTLNGGKAASTSAEAAPPQILTTN
ncbi:uncharacterized protein LOC110372508 [Helicoverpa armigera]|uniref:uncharacterized protein LOC110372508 n=1 Tax=Helicoverpa armigera TaxID=29058 RepID=UPI003082711B